MHGADTTFLDFIPVTLEAPQDKLQKSTSEMKSGSKVTEQWFSHVRVTELSSRGLIQTQAAEPHPGASDSLCVRWSPRICVLNKLPSDADAAGCGYRGKKMRVSSSKLFSPYARRRRKRD